MNKHTQAGSGSTRNPLCDLHAQVHGRGPRAGIQHARRPARMRGSVHQEPGGRRLAMPAGPLRRRRLHRRQHGPPGSASACWPTSRPARGLRSSSTKSIASAARCSTSRKMMEIFEKHQVAFVSVTQQINSRHVDGPPDAQRAAVSFAQFEREIIGERTRDKIAAARRKGKWAGGHHILGYDVDANGFKLVVNEDEAVARPGHLRAVPGA